jgi:hypothetical protein
VKPLLSLFVALVVTSSCVNEMPPATPPPGSDANGEHQQGPPSNNSSAIGGFEIRRDAPVLLPFWVRHQKLATILDVPTSDPVFAFLVENRLLLGDNDHASGVAPELSWNPAKMSLWAKALRPVCAHPNMKARHPFLNIDLPRAAWGRDVTPDEAEGIRADLDDVYGAGVQSAERDEAACIAILSSLEMVTQ